MGIELRVVEQDPASNWAPWADCPPLRVLRTHRLGGIVDPRLRRMVVKHRDPGYQGRGRPTVWYCSTAQEPLLLHGEDQPQKILAYGAMGAGKTRLLAMWLVLRSIELCEWGLCQHRPRAIGATGATTARLDLIYEALSEISPASWGYRRRKADEVVLHCGVTLQMRATKQQSGAVGTPIQGQNWSAHAGDEYQDQSYAHAHILARGRDAPNGKYKQLCTATAKDSAAWRDFRDSLPEEYWGIRRLEGPQNPFKPLSWWEDLRRNMSEREYKMYVLAEDVGPERAMYPAWRRDRNLRPLPRVGGTDITAKVTGGYHMLVGFDPGALRHVSVLLLAYRLGHDSLPHWFVVGEVVTEHATAEEHALSLVQRLHGWGVQKQDPLDPRALVKVDPWTQSDAGTHHSVYAQLHNVGLTTVSANYRESGKRSNPQPVHRGASIDMVNGLLHSASGNTRLYVALDEDTGEPLAPKTAKALELAEWRPDGYRENVKKDDKSSDWSDFHSALRYALWGYEKPRHGVDIRAFMARGQA